MEKTSFTAYVSSDVGCNIDFSLEEFEAFGLKFEFVTRDLHNSEMNEGNVMTEYEKNFSDKGQPIYSAQVRF